MTAVFKPGDRVRVTEACETIEMRGLLGVVLGGPNVNVRMDNGSRAMFMPDELEPAPASSPDTTEAGAAGERDALREELAKDLGDYTLCESDLRTILTAWVEPEYPSASEMAAATGWAERHLTALASIALGHTAKALETALRERDEALKALEPFAKAAAIVEWSQRATGQSYRDEAPFQSGLAWQEKDGSARTITYADLRRARACLSPTQESTHADA